MSTSAPIVWSKGPSIIEARKKLIKNAKERNVDSERVTQVLFDINYRYNPRAYSIMDVVFGDNDRLTWTVEELSDNDKLNIVTSYAYQEVHEELSNHGYKILDYIAGSCVKADGSDSRTFKIGRILARYKASPDIVSAFTHDKNRQASKKKYKITLSRNPYDIITMSTFRGWSSCMGITSGNYSYVSQDISAGTLIIYVHTEDDTNIDTPAGRILVKPFISHHDDDGEICIFYKVENDSYGSIPNCATEKFKEIQDYINKKIVKTNKPIKGLFVNGLYNDGVGSVSTYIPDNITLDIENINLDNMSRNDIKAIIQTYDDHTEFLKNRQFYNYIDYSKIKDFDKFIKILEDGPIKIYMDIMLSLVGKIYDDEFLDRLNEKDFFNKIPNNYLMKFMRYINYDSFIKYFSGHKKFKVLYKAIYNDFVNVYGDEKVLLTIDDYKVLNNAHVRMTSHITNEILEDLFKENCPMYIVYCSTNLISYDGIVKSSKFNDTSLKFKMAYYHFIYRNNNDGPQTIAIMNEFNNKFNTKITPTELAQASRAYYVLITGANGLVDVPFIFDSEVYEF